jgi:hypothetical protein
VSFTEQELLELIAIDDRLIRDCGSYRFRDGIEMGKTSKARWQRMLDEVRAARNTDTSSVTP